MADQGKQKRESGRRSKSTRTYSTIRCSEHSLVAFFLLFSSVTAHIDSTRSNNEMDRWSHTHFTRWQRSLSSLPDSVVLLMDCRECVVVVIGVVWAEGNRRVPQLLLSWDGFGEVFSCLSLVVSRGKRRSKGDVSKICSPFDGRSVSSLYSPRSSQLPAFDISARTGVRKSSVDVDSHREAVGSSMVGSSCVWVTRASYCRAIWSRNPCIN